MDLLHSFETYLFSGIKLGATFARFPSTNGGFLSNLFSLHFTVFFAGEKKRSSLLEEFQHNFFPNSNFQLISLFIVAAQAIATEDKCTMVLFANAEKRYNFFISKRQIIVSEKKKEEQQHQNINAFLSFWVRLFSQSIFVKEKFRQCAWKLAHKDCLAQLWRTHCLQWPLQQNNAIQVKTVFNSLSIYNIHSAHYNKLCVKFVRFFRTIIIFLLWLPSKRSMLVIYLLLCCIPIFVVKRHSSISDN